MNYLVYIIAATLLLLALSMINLLRYRKKYSRLCRQQNIIDDKTRSVSAQYQQLKDKVEQNHSFSKNLREADEATTRMQMSTSSYHARAATVSIPERYQYIRSLSGKGTEATEIATLFSISQQEADQLVTLSQINPGCKSY
jgi:hypothetical protein